MYFHMVTFVLLLAMAKWPFSPKISLANHFLNIIAMNWYSLNIWFLLLVMSDNIWKFLFLHRQIEKDLVMLILTDWSQRRVKCIWQLTGECNWQMIISSQVMPSLCHFIHTSSTIGIFQNLHKHRTDHLSSKGWKILVHPNQTCFCLQNLAHI